MLKETDSGSSRQLFAPLFPVWGQCVRAFGGLRMISQPWTASGVLFHSHLQASVERQRLSLVSCFPVEHQKVGHYRTPTVMSRKTGPGWISYLRLGAFCTNSGVNDS